MSHGGKASFGNKSTGWVEYRDLSESLSFRLGFVIANACNSAEGVNMLKAEQAKFASCDKLCNGGAYNWVADLVTLWKYGKDAPGIKNDQGKDVKPKNGYVDLTHPSERLKPGELGTKKP